MVAITTVADRMQAETGYTDSDITNTNLEYLIDNAIDHVNLVCGTSIADLSGVAAAKTLTATENELAVLKPLINLMMRAYIDKGPNINAATMGVMEIATDPHYKIMYALWKESAGHLRGRSFERT